MLHVLLELEVKRTMASAADEQLPVAVGELLPHASEAEPPDGIEDDGDTITIRVLPLGSEREDARRSAATRRQSAGKHGLRNLSLAFGAFVAVVTGAILVAKFTARPPGATCQNTGTCWLIDRYDNVNLCLQGEYYQERCCSCGGGTKAENGPTAAPSAAPPSSGPEAGGS
mmetsp:Transcript_39728/g.67714  ORF Transcript_39728/g.67714 Transcript_39728/m.67714 type:complete len:171 (+) Transcript_39728:83-595(+)